MAMPSEFYSEKQTNSTNQYQTTAILQFEEATATTHGTNGTVESAELLRWRADILLDEMLLGGADIGTGHTGLVKTTVNGIYPATTNGNHNRSDPYITEPYLADTHPVRNGYHHDSQPPTYAEILPTTPSISPQQPLVATNGQINSSPKPLLVSGFRLRLPKKE